MLSSITGQNERWAQLAAYQATPAAQSSQITGGTSAYASSSLWAEPGSGAVTGDTSSSIADGTNFALMAFGSPPQAGGTTGAANGGSITTSGTSAMSQLLTDLQSLLSTLGGTSSSASGSGTAGTSSTDTDTDSPSVSNSGTTASPLAQDLQKLSTDLGSLASTLGTTHRGERGDHDGPQQPSGPPPGSSDILNSGTVSASAGSTIGNSGTAPASNGWATFMQQFAAGAYGSGYDGSTTSSLLAINA
nr:hypothetical protein [uncultured Rhodopila sp.]